MNREIKFRGKDVKTKQWVYGYYSCGYREYSFQETEEYKHWIESWNGRSYFISEVDQNTVGQFTGLLDKNGKEIYEGDIVCEDGDVEYYKTLSHDELLKMCNRDNSAVFVVKYGLEEVDAFYGMAFNMWSFNGMDNGERLSSEHIVIGNIHD